MSALSEKGGEFGEHIIEDVLRHAFEFAAVARGQIEGPGLVAANDAGGSRPGVSQRNSKPRSAGKGPA